jgi:hypothetical protein
MPTIAVPKNWAIKKLNRNFHNEHVDEIQANYENDGSERVAQQFSKFNQWI